MNNYIFYAMMIFFTLFILAFAIDKYNPKIGMYFVFAFLGYFFVMLAILMGLGVTKLGEL